MGLYDTYYDKLGGRDYDDDDGWTSEDSKELIEVDMDCVFDYDEDTGDVEVVEDKPSWGKSSENSKGEWYSEDGVFIEFPEDVEYNAFELIPDSAFPKTSGRYRATGKVKLVYDVYGVEKKYTYYKGYQGEDEYDEEVYKDNATVEYVPDESSITDLKIERA